MLKNLATRAGMAVLGVVMTLAWWSFRGGSGIATTALDRIPDRVFAADAGTLDIEVETSGPARMHAAFEKQEPHTMLEATEMIGAGSRSWTIAVPAGTYASFNLTAEKPQVGAKLRWVLRLNGKVIAEESQTLDAPLKDGWAFGLGREYADIAAGTEEND